MAEDKDIPEWWNMDVTLAGIIAEKLRLFIEHSAGKPSNYASQKEWEEKINSIIIRLERYQNKFDYGFQMENEITNAGVEAMQELANIFPSLWS